MCELPQLRGDAVNMYSLRSTGVAGIKFKLWGGMPNEPFHFSIQIKDLLASSNWTINVIAHALSSISRNAS